MMDETLLMELTADIVSAHVGHNSVEAAKLPRLIQSVYSALADAGAPAVPAEVPLQPKVSVRSSVKDDAIVCIDCGARMKMLKRHLMVDHGLSPTEYRERWGLPRDYPMVAPDYSRKRQELAIQIGLGRKAGTKVTSGRPKVAVPADG